jgi:hypothetical protein
VRWFTRGWTVLVVRSLVLLVSPRVSADEVDAHYAAGNAAAQAGDWQRAVAEYERAATLLPQRSALVSYDLGTAYAHVGELGRATYHLRRAMDFRAGPTTEILESARHNLGVVRRRVELQATASGTLVDRPETWWDLIVEALRAPGIGWLALTSGWGFLGVAFVHRRRRLEGRSTAISGALSIVLAVCFVVPGILHAMAIRADRTAPAAIVLDERVDAREGPGSHRKVELTLQGGAQVRIVDRAPGWVHVRLPGGIEGWVPETTVGELAAVHPSAGTLTRRSRRDQPMPQPSAATLTPTG